MSIDLFGTKYQMHKRRLEEVEVSFDTRILDCYTELKRLRNKQYNCDFNDQAKETKQYKSRADAIQDLINKGIDYLPTF